MKAQISQMICHLLCSLKVVSSAPNETPLCSPFTVFLFHRNTFSSLHHNYQSQLSQVLSFSPQYTLIDTNKAPVCSQLHSALLLHFPLFHIIAMHSM